MSRPSRGGDEAHSCRFGRRGKAVASRKRPDAQAVAGRRGLGALALLGWALLAAPLAAEQVGEVDVDWIGNDIIIEAIADPDVAGVTCHIAYFDRGLVDRLSKGNWFEDPSNASIACRQTGPIEIGDIDTSEGGEDVFTERRSIVLKSLRIKRIYDEENRVLIYLAHARELTDGSAKMSISTVPLFQPGS